MNIEKNLAERGKRFGAYLIDIIPIILMVFFIFYLFLDFDKTLTNYLNRGSEIEPRIQFLKERNWIRETSFIIWILYCIIMESSKYQGTFGKHIMGIKVIDENGTRLSFSKSTARNISKIVSYLILALGFLWILFDKKKQGWHDKLSKTFVVNKEFQNI
ncbi:RDD family protein [Flavobacterium succinicans]|uniref:RDD family protein n=1 Tax=Flavobacterium succinicans TaxID=29536 RepID=A0A199XR83_9FLAO|nr:RDD family protein [Flavobacterium succinicans]OAZ03756.1 RDD family protein [Flavobacterium succinicans]